MTIAVHGAYTCITLHQPAKVPELKKSDAHLGLPLTAHRPSVLFYSVNNFSVICFCFVHRPNQQFFSNVWTEPSLPWY